MDFASFKPRELAEPIMHCSIISPPDDGTEFENFLSLNQNTACEYSKEPSQ